MKTGTVGAEGKEEEEGVVEVREEEAGKEEESEETGAGVRGESAKWTCREGRGGEEGVRREEEGGRPGGGGRAGEVKGPITAGLRWWTETVSVREPSCSVKKWGEQEITGKGTE